MGNATGPILRAVGTIVGAIVSIYYPGAGILIAGAFNVGASDIERRQANRRAKDAWNASLTDRLVVLRGTDVPIYIGYGRCRMGGYLAYAESTGTLKEKLQLVVGFYPGHEIDGIESLFSGEFDCSTVDVNGRVTTGQFFKTRITGDHQTDQFASTHNAAQAVTLSRTPTSNIITAWTDTDQVSPGVPRGSRQLPVVSCVGTAAVIDTSSLAAARVFYVSYQVTITTQALKYNKHLGSPTQIADADLIAASAGKWTSAHQGRGRPYVYAEYTYDEDIFAGVGDPSQITVIARLKKIFDHRSSTTSWKANSALAIHDYLTDPLGFNIPTTDIDYTTFDSAATRCDDVIAIVDRARAAGAHVADFVSTVEGYTFSGATTSFAAGMLRVTSTGTDPQIISPAISVAGGTYKSIRARIKRVSGSGWDGTAFYTTGGHGFSVSFRKTITEPVYDASGWAIADFDMSALTVGGTDWVFNTVTQIRLDLGATASDVFDIDWIYVGSENTQARYEVNGLLSTEVSPIDNLRALEGTCHGRVVWVQGKWRLYVGEYVHSGVTLDTSDLVDGGDITIVNQVERANTVNYVRGNFVDPVAFYQTNDFPPLQSAALEAEDGGRVELSLQFPLTTDVSAAQRLATMELKLARQIPFIQCNFGYRGYKMTPGDILTLNLPNYGINSNFLIVDRAFSLDKLARLTLMHIASTDFDWTFQQAQIVPPSPVSTLPSPSVVAAPLGLALTQLGIRQQNDGSVAYAIRFSWTASTDQAVINGGYVQTQYKSTLDPNPSWTDIGQLTGDAASTVITGLIDSLGYFFRVRFVNGAGAKSEWNLIAGGPTSDTSAPPAPVTATLVVLNDGTRQFLVGMPAPNADQGGYRDVNTFIIGRTFGATISWGTATLLVAQASTIVNGNYYYVETGLPEEPGYWSFEVRSVNNRGIISTSGVQILNQYLSQNLFDETLNPDPYFDNWRWWSYVRWDQPGWYYEHWAAGDSCDGLGVRGGAVLSSSAGGGLAFTGTTPTVLQAQYIAFSATNVKLRLRARCWNNSNQDVAVTCQFIRGDGVGLGGGNVGFPAGSGITQGYTLITVPATAAFANLYINNIGGAAFSGFATISEVKLDIAADNQEIVPGAATVIYNAASANSASCGYDQTVGGTHSGTRLWDKSVSSPAIVMQTGESLAVHVQCTGTADYQNVTTHASTRIGIDVVVSGSGKAQFHVDATDKTGNYREWEMQQATTNGSLPKEVTSGEYTYTAPSPQTVTVYGGAGLRSVTADGLSSGQVTMRVEHIRR